MQASSSTSSLSPVPSPSPEFISDRTRRYLRRNMATTTVVTEVVRHLTTAFEQGAGPSGPVRDLSDPPEPPRDPPDGPPGGPPDGGPPDDEPDAPFEEPPSDPEPEPDDANSTAISDQQLQQILAQLAGPRQPKFPFKAKELDTYNGGTTEGLRTFILQCELYFRTKQSEFTNDVH